MCPLVKGEVVKAATQSLQRMGHDRTRQETFKAVKQIQDPKVRSAMMRSLRNPSISVSAQVAKQGIKALQHTEEQGKQSALMGWKSASRALREANKKIQAVHEKHEGEAPGNEKEKSDWEERVEEKKKEAERVVDEDIAKAHEVAAEHREAAKQGRIQEEKHAYGKEQIKKMHDEDPIEAAKHLPVMPI